MITIYTACMSLFSFLRHNHCVSRLHTRCYTVDIKLFWCPCCSSKCNRLGHSIFDKKITGKGIWRWRLENLLWVGCNPWVMTRHTTPCLWGSLKLINKQSKFQFTTISSRLEASVTRGLHGNGHTSAFPLFCIIDEKLPTTSVWVWLIFKWLIHASVLW